MNIDFKKLLIVDDDHYFREVLSACLTKMQYNILCVESVAQARKAVELFAPDLILTDMQMPGETGIDLVRFIKSTYPKIPCVVMTGFADILDSVKAAGLGADAFIAKPFKETELKTIISKILNPPELVPTEEETYKEPSSDFCKIGIDEFISGKSLKYSIYVCTGSAENGFRYVKVAHAGEDLSPQRVSIYKQKGLNYLYIRAEDFRSYIGLMEKLINASNKTKSLIPPEKQARLINHALELVNQELLALPLSTDAFEHASTMLEVTVNLMANEESTFNLLNSLKDLSDQVYAHSVMVSVLSTIIAKEMGWSSTSIQIKVATAGLMHDIGKRQLPRDLLEKSRSQMTADELKQYEMHPQRGYEILADSTRYAPEILQSVLHHHERTNGSGFPNHLILTKIIPLATVIAVADEFSHDYKKCRDQGVENPISLAVERLLATKADFLHGPAVQALVNALLKSANQPQDKAKNSAH